MTTAPINLDELEKGLVCLIPKPGVAMPTCHEFSVCDCTVLALVAELRKARQECEDAHKDALQKGHEAAHWRAQKLTLETLHAEALAHLSAERAKSEQLQCERDELNEAIHEARAQIGAKSEDLRVDIEWLQEERDAWKAEVGKLQAYCAIARERLGPAGYQILQEVVQLRARVAELESSTP